MALTADQFAQQMIAQARLMDPSLSCEVGTPERKIIDTVAQSLAENQVDLTGLSSALDIDAKFGTNLDRFTALFGFARQQPGAATGFVIFSRNTPAPVNITIASGIVIQSSSVGPQGQLIQFTTTATGSIAVGQTTSGAVPIQCVVTGSIGNVAANTVTVMVGQPAVGVTSVTNPNALTNGVDGEDDNSYKTRFKNTVFRNLAGTTDQYLALAVNGPYTTKANVIGVQSRYQEYIQVPQYDDAGYRQGAYYAQEDVHGHAYQWTSAMSVIPFAKYIYSSTGAFVSNGASGPTKYFYRPDTDFIFNYPPSASGDTLRFAPQTVTAGQQNFGATIQVYDTAGLPHSGWVSVLGTAVSYTGITTNSLTGCTPARNPSFPPGAIPTATVVYLIPPEVYGLPANVRPNFTFLNVYNPPAGAVPLPALQTLAPGDVVLSEFSYVSTASRNDIIHRITNAVDVYVNGTNDTQASCAFVPYLAQTQFSTNPSSPWYYENYRRAGEPAKRPQIGNAVTTLFQTPLSDLPDSITINGENYYKGWHYWLVKEVGSLHGTVRARDGIEWHALLGGDTGQGPPSDPKLPYEPQGSSIYAVNSQPDALIEIDNYLFDANIPTIQANIDDAKQIATDVLTHQAYTRYFKLDIAVIYSGNANYTAVNSAIATAIQAYFNNQYFGAIIQLSTLLEVIAQISGVGNVRWTGDTLGVQEWIAVTEVDVHGNPLQGASIDRFVYGSNTRIEQQTLYIAGNPRGYTITSTGPQTDYFTLTWTDASLPGGSLTTGAIPFYHTDTQTPITASEIQSAIQAAASHAQAQDVYAGITVTTDTRPTTSVAHPISSFTVKYGSLGTPVVPTVTNYITASDYAWDTDFFILDDELPSLPTGQIAGDSLPGLIIRPRTPNTWLQPVQAPPATSGIFGGPGTFGVTGDFGGSGQAPGGGKDYGSAGGTFGTDSDAFGN